MKNFGRKLLIFFLAVLACGMLAGCGKKSEPDKDATQVMKLSITPEVTPTLAPEQVNAKAVEKNGSLMMINEYLAKEGNYDAADSAVLPQDVETENAGAGNEDGDGVYDGEE